MHLYKLQSTRPYPLMVENMQIIGPYPAWVAGEGGIVYRNFRCPLLFLCCCKAYLVSLLGIHNKLRIYHHYHALFVCLLVGQVHNALHHAQMLTNVFEGVVEVRHKAHNTLLVVVNVGPTLQHASSTSLRKF
jgi:hypothetical protein